jgi:hypothetical protein
LWKKIQCAIGAKKILSRSFCMKKSKILIVLLIGLLFSMAGCEQEDCSWCYGSGKDPVCNGTGLVKDKKSPFDVECRDCRGSGKCPSCQGTGKVKIGINGGSL